jgi:predicted Zn finger-like uncharacterized protein
MYTQCPECGEAFRVTAEVLRQAAGKVRCGGCGVAFNALDHLSEQLPKPASRGSGRARAAQPKPEPPGELEADTPPRTISAERSAALLKTLDQLAGSDNIRIEDTGVEWRVLDDDEELAADTPARQDFGDETEEPELIADTGTLRFIVEGDDEGLDEVLDASPTPVDELLTEAPARVESEEVFEEMRFDDNTPLPDDFEFDDRRSRPPPTIEAPADAVDPGDAQVDLAFGDPDEWQDLLGEVEAAAVTAPAAAEESAPAASRSDQSADDLVVLGESLSDKSGDEPLDTDTQFAIQAEAMGIDLSGMHTALDEQQPEPEDDQGGEPETSIDDDLIAAAFEAEAAAHSHAESAGVAGVDDDDDVEPAIDDIEFDNDVELAVEDDEFAAIVEDFDDATTAENSDQLQIMLDDELAEDDGSRDAVPELTEEEKTINLLIDQDLLSVAVEDEDGFTSTIVQIQPDRKVGKEIARNRDDTAERSPLVETIIMEGDFISSAADDDSIETASGNARRGAAAAAQMSRPTMRAASKYSDDGEPSHRFGTAAGIALLALLLAGQVVHQSRDAFATVPAFNRTVGPLYRMLGRPLTPAWNVSGWRFEATKGSTDETEQRLTIYSRIGNKSDAALPYPLVHVSLTDRFEEIIGSRILEPGEYLAADADPRQPVAPGNSFNAVIAIDSPSPEATGFQLNVCYRLAGGQLRCAIEDFK